MKIRLSIAGAWMKSLDVTAPASRASADPGAAIIEGRANSAFDMAVLGGATAVASAIAYWQFSRRDL